MAGIDELEEAVHCTTRCRKDNVREAECFRSHRGGDRGIANVNIGTSAAEIGSSFELEVE